MACLWREPFGDAELAELYKQDQGRRTVAEPSEWDGSSVDYTRRALADDLMHWGRSKLAVEKLGFRCMRMALIWAKADFASERLSDYMGSDGPDFQNEAASVIHLGFMPLTQAVVLCEDETTVIRASDWVDPVVLLLPGRAEADGFEYFQLGSLSICIALDTQAGRGGGKMVDRETIAEFVAFLTELITTNRWVGRSTPSWTISRPTSRIGTVVFCTPTRGCVCISRPLMPYG